MGEGFWGPKGDQNFIFVWALRLFGFMKPVVLTDLRDLLFLGRFSGYRLSDRPLLLLNDFCGLVPCSVAMASTTCAFLQSCCRGVWAGLSDASVSLGPCVGAVRKSFLAATGPAFPAPMQGVDLV